MLDTDCLPGSKRKRLIRGTMEPSGSITTVRSLNFHVILEFALSITHPKYMFSALLPKKKTCMHSTPLVCRYQATYRACIILCRYRMKGYCWSKAFFSIAFEATGFDLEVACNRRLCVKINFYLSFVRWSRSIFRG